VGLGLVGSEGLKDGIGEVSPRQSGAQPYRAGWDYRIFGGLEQPALATLTFLAGYRT
jgi:hypothetical protein